MQLSMQNEDSSVYRRAQPIGNAIYCTVLYQEPNILIDSSFGECKRGWRPRCLSCSFPTTIESFAEFRTEPFRLVGSRSCRVSGTSTTSALTMQVSCLSLHARVVAWILWYCGVGVASIYWILPLSQPVMAQPRGWDCPASTQ